MTKIRNLIFRGQKGIGLLELMLSLAIIAILLVMATRYYLSASLSSDVNEIISNIHGVEACYANLRPALLTKFSLQTCIDQGWFPAGVKGAADNTIRTPWGEATIAPSDNDIKIKITANNTKQATALYAKLTGTTPTALQTDTTITYSIVTHEIVANDKPS